MSASSQAYLNTRVTALSERLLERAQLLARVGFSLPKLAERFQLESLMDEQSPTRTKSRAVEQTLIRVLLEGTGGADSANDGAGARPSVGLGPKVRAV
ncbi:MAG: hypothetical protein WBG92_06750 [Thiohalocapsa sp.]